MFPYESKILIVDDMKGIRLWLQKTLQAMGYKNFDEASNGEEALEFVAKTKYDLIFLDIVMPKMNGIEFLKRLQKNLPPVIILSAETDGQLIVDAIKLGSSQYILKPATRPVLEKKMAEVFELSKKAGA